nr:structural protein [Tolivirales sp.]
MAPSKSMTASKASSNAQAGKSVRSRALAMALKSALNARASANKRKPVRTPNSGIAPFSGVSQVDIAPVNIGNTIRSARQVVIPTRDGVTVTGRDFVTVVGGTVPSYVGWTLQGGVGLSPLGLNASGLRGFFQTYQWYKWEKCVAHYITSSPTSTSGDVLLMYHANHGGPKADHTSTNFMSYALSTDSALLGPQWTNHSVEIIQGEHKWKETDVLNTEDVSHQTDGELLVYTKAATNGSAADPPGYLLIDYKISFQNRMLNPRIQTLPSGLFKFIPTGIHVNTPPTQFEVWSADFLLSTKAYNNAPIVPTGASVGDIFQVILDLQNATFTNITAGNAFVVNIAHTGNAGAGTYIPFPLTTGMTIYAVIGSTVANGSVAFFPNYSAIFAGNTLRYANTSIPPVTIDCAAVFSCVGSVSTKFTQANIG